MKKALLLLVVMGLVSVPALCPAETLPGCFPNGSFAKVNETELAQNSGHGWDRQGSVHNQEGRIVIWDEWGHSAMTNNGGGASLAGQASINYGQQRATIGVTSTK
jgi:hypothetical protein